MTSRIALTWLIAIAVAPASSIPLAVVGAGEAPFRSLLCFGRWNENSQDGDENSD